MNKTLCVILTALLSLGPVGPLWAQSGGNCSIFRSWITGDSLTAGDLTSSMTTVGVTNMTQACIDGISDTVAGMQTTTNPYASDTESLATSGAGEIQRLRYVIESFFGLANWYRVDSNINFGGMGVTKTGIDGAGTGAHVTAVGLHLWGGSARFPSLTGRYVHTTGLFWPAVHHLAISVDPANDADKGGVELVRFHAQGMTLHHTAAIRFWHSTGGATATGHITAIQVSRGLASAAGDEASGRDTLLFGHATTVLQMRGYGASHIALGSGSYLRLGAHRTAIAAPVAGAMYGTSLIRAWATWNGGTADTPVLDGMNIAGVTDVGTGYYVVRWLTAFETTNYAVIGTAAFGDQQCGLTVEAKNVAHANVRTWSNVGGALDCTIISILAIGS